MSTLTQFVGIASTTSIINAYSSGGARTGTSLNSGKEVLSGALTANTLSTVLAVSGSGAMPQLCAYSKDATARTIRLVVIVDGVTVFDATSSSITAANDGLFAAGTFVPNVLTNGEPIIFNSSLTVQVASSLAETDKVAVGYVLCKR